MLPVNVRSKNGGTFKVVIRGAFGPTGGKRLVFQAADQVKARKFLRALPAPELSKLGRLAGKGVHRSQLVNTLVVELCSKQLVVYEVGTNTDSATIEKLHRDIKLQLGQIIQQERLEAARIEAEHQQRNGLGKALAYAGKFGQGLGESAWSMLTWAKDVYDVVSLQERVNRLTRAAWESYSDDSGRWADKFSEAVIASEHKELVEALGFDPLKIDRAMLASAYEVAHLIWEDEATQQILLEFTRDYAGAQHSLEWTQIGGGAAFEIILTAVLAALTGGVGAVASLGSKARLLGPLRKLGGLFQDLAKLLKKAKRRKRAKSSSASGSKISDYQSDSPPPAPSDPPPGSPRPKDVDAPKKAPKFTDLKKMDDQYIGEETGAVWGTKVKYLDEVERQQYQLQIKDGKLYDADGELFDTAKARSAFGGEGNAIFVMDEHGSIYASTVHSPGKFHHSSFLSGQPVASAGEIVVENGVLKGVTRRSGHYQPTAEQLDQFVQQLKRSNVSLDNVNIGAGF